MLQSPISLYWTSHAMYVSYYYFINRIHPCLNHRATPAGQQGTRLKPVVFRDLGAFLELPKSLATLRCPLVQRYDHRPTALIAETNQSASRINLNTCYLSPACDCHHVLSHPSSGGTFTTLALRVLYSARDPLAVLNQGALVSIGGVVMVQVRAA
jgi:hypothetical protein